jgi:V/A-type H+-transporting ATPase subunit I
MVLSSFTIIAGLFLNTFFGHDIFNLPGTKDAFFHKATGIALFGPVETAKGKVFPAMTFALYIGAVQILLGMALRAVNRIRNYGLLWGLAPLASMLMAAGAIIFLAHKNFMGMGVYVLGAVPVGNLLNAIPLTVSLWLCIIGLVILFLFNDPSKKIIVRFALGFWELYQFAQGLAGDGLSYVRLFALGLAGGLLGAAFNDIAFMIITDSEGVVHYGSPLIIFTILILVVGHTLNLALSGLGAFVHSLRLTFVEFYNNLKFKGGAKGYAPLANSEARS